ncbi:MAG: hypothetical protein MJ211_15970, partial [Bacteroidales bacterium]|nr:hypothetical protein [Bacteroidales bacterium]
NEETNKLNFAEGLEKGEKLGLEKGEKIGLEKGEKIGIEKERAEMVRKMKAKGFSIEDICELSGLSISEIEKL